MGPKVPARTFVFMPGRLIRGVLMLCIAVWGLSAQKPSQQYPVSPDVRAMLDRVSADSMRGHLSFIASDALEGRNTPSRGLEIAAEYIAAQFRRAGLEPVGDEGYFQNAKFLLAETPMSAFELAFKAGAETISVPGNQVSFNIDKELNLTFPVFKADYADGTAIAALKPEQIEGKTVITEIQYSRGADEARRLEMYYARVEFLNKMAGLKAALVISVDRGGSPATGAGQGRLIDPENRRASAPLSPVPVITVHDPRIVKQYDLLKPGLTNTELKLHLPAQVEHPVRLRNVIGVLRGSDPVLKDSYVLLTAHYDHIGVRPELPGDNIFNGANDNGSGTVSVIELASALAPLKQRPRRSIAFIAFFGEERGLMGARFYARHPVFPIAQTVADINLEHMGRTDSNEGPQIASATLTGFDFTNIGTIMEAAGKATGIRVYKDETNSDAFFERSDNQALADVGVPAHTACAAFTFPDYHGAGDHWDKIDYANMEKLDRMIGLSLIMIANDPEPPKWNEAKSQTARYVRAWNLHHQK